MAVPFEIPEINHGLKKATGLIKLVDESFNLEFEVKDGFVGIFKSGISEAEISFDELESIAYDKGWLSDKIILSGTSMQAFDDVPGTEVAVCKLKIKRKHRNEAQNMVSKARMLLSEFRLDRMDDGGNK